ncbi:MAG: sulfotransferase family protein [Porticoccaceae bacterium]
MTLSIIGAGFGRTGTVSLRAALERLDRGPVHHMMEVIKNPAQSPLWVQALTDSSVLRQILADYRSAIDWPTCHFWRDLMDLYPTAKVILTLRDSTAWYESIRNTIYRVLSEQPSALPSGQVSMARRIIWEDTFAGRLGDREHAMAVFEKHNAEVIATVPPKRLLVFQVSEGWQPLCDFLGQPVPAEPFPKANSTEEFLALFAKDGPGGH